MREFECSMPLLDKTNRHSLCENETGSRISVATSIAVSVGIVPILTRSGIAPVAAPPVADCCWVILWDAPRLTDIIFYMI